MNVQTKQPSAHAPTKADPIRLANATIQAVDRIGETTSEEIEKTAKEITHGAAQIAEKLQELANAIREHSKIANEHVTQFCEKATSVFDGIRDLQQTLEVKERKAETEAVDEEILPMPVFLNGGPAKFSDPRL
jgi:methyl-accepting chemotaxis protein